MKCPLLLSVLLLAGFGCKSDDKQPAESAAKPTEASKSVAAIDKAGGEEVVAPTEAVKPTTRVTLAEGETLWLSADGEELAPTEWQDDSRLAIVITQHSEFEDGVLRLYHGDEGQNLHNFSVFCETRCDAYIDVLDDGRAIFYYGNKADPEGHPGSDTYVLLEWQKDREQAQVVDSWNRHDKKPEPDWVKKLP